MSAYLFPAHRGVVWSSYLAQITVTITMFTKAWARLGKTSRDIPAAYRETHSLKSGAGRFKPAPSSGSGKQEALRPDFRNKTPGPSKETECYYITTNKAYTTPS